MKIEAVIVCKDYSDFLSYTLPENLQHLDRVVVVTHPDDKATQSLCTKFGVDFIDTTVMHDDGDAFNKGRAINLGLSHLRHEGWILHLDADILLPHRFREMLKKAKLDKSCLYGCDRMNVKSFENFKAHQHKLVPHFQWRYLVNPVEEFPVGSRLLHNELGYCPIGFFQLWHTSANRKYPIATGSAEHSDVLFSAQWPREKRILLPEFFVTHLETTRNFGENWNGRRSPNFGPHHPDQKQPKHYGK